MQTELNSTDIPGLQIIRVKRTIDPRGLFIKPFSNQLLAQHGIQFDVKETFFSVSSERVLRGMHFQSPPHQHAKLVFCLAGRVLDVILDLRVDSSAFGRTSAMKLDAKDPTLIYIPPGLAHGFYTESHDSLLGYWVDSAYSEANDLGILWNSIDFKWPDQKPILSERDLTFPSLKDFSSPFSMV